MKIHTNTSIIAEFEKQRNLKFTGNNPIDDKTIIENLAQKNDVGSMDIVMILENHYNEKNRPDMQFSKPTSEK
ncbi:hypothetical protein [Epilithonimonas tenax]|uniref:hypothetical protein n=1 Tax=Epilithonimonas tenax TaxID=191577 RepID=UPI0004296427|nr:hypothetical protein [Epilithonimonas tenax]